MVGTRVYIGGLPYGAREKDLERFFKGYGRIRDVLIKNGYGFVEFEDYRDADDAVYELNGKELLGERVLVEPARGSVRGAYNNNKSSSSSHGYGSSSFSRRRGNDRVSVEKARGAPRGSDLWRGRSSGGSMSSGPSYGGSSRNSSRRPSYGMDRPGVERYGPPTRTEFRLIVENLSSRVSWQDLKDYMRQAGEVTYADAHKQRRNEGVVEFATYQDMRNAIDKLDDTDLNGRRIRLVEDTRRRRRSRSSSSRSRSRSRSRGRRTRSRSRSRSRRSSRSRSRGRSSRSKSRSKSRGRTSRSRSHSKSRSRSRSAGGKKPATTRRRSKSKERSPKREKESSRSRSKSRSRSAEKNDKPLVKPDAAESGPNHDNDVENNHRSVSPEAKRHSASPPGARSEEEGSEDGHKGGESMEDD